MSLGEVINNLVVGCGALALLAVMIYALGYGLGLLFGWLLTKLVGDLIPLPYDKEEENKDNEHSTWKGNGA